MDLGLTGKRAIVCASSRGLGSACAMALAKEGAAVVINGRDQTGVEAALRELRAIGDQADAVVGDIGDAIVQAALFERCPEPDILVTNNGGPPSKRLEDLRRADILDGLIKNMIVPIEMIQRAVTGMRRKGFGRIVNITSVAALMPVAGLPVSSGARAGLTAFVAGFGREVGKEGITINNLLPDRILTDRLRQRIAWHAQEAGISVEEEAERQAAETPMGRFGTAEEFGEICAFLCSRQSGYITGRNILVDGGLMPATF